MPHPLREGRDDVQDHREYDATVDVFAGEATPDPSSPVKFNFSWRKLWRFAGPGWLMSLAYLDPGNLEGDLQQGAYTGLQLTWVLFWATVMGLILQEMSARLGLVTGCDLAQSVRAYYPRWLCYTVYVMMEIAVIGADIQEVVGSGIALKILFGIPVWVGCLITGFDTFTFLIVQYAGIRYLELMICTLIGTMAICFFVNWGQANTDTTALFEGWVVPMLPSYALTQAVGTIGAVIMPHNLYLHSGLVLSRKIKRESPNRVYAAIWYSRIEAAVALLFSFFINLAIIAANANPFYNQTCAELDGGPYACLLPSDVASSSGDDCDLPVTPCVQPASGLYGVCDEIGLDVEGDAMASSMGASAKYIWAVGLLAAGQSSTMVCTYAGQIIMGGCLQIELAPWKRVAITRIFALGPALAVALSTVSNTKLFNNINEYLNILQSVQLPFAMLPVLHFAYSKRLLGRFASGPKLFAVSCALAFVVLAVNVLLIVQFLQDPPVEEQGAEADYTLPPWVMLLVSVYGIVYFGVCLRMMDSEVISLVRWAQRALGLAAPKPQLPRELHGVQLSEARGRDEVTATSSSGAKNGPVC